jgi:hypothetical protein
MQGRQPPLSDDQGAEGTLPAGAPGLSD